MKNIWGKPFSHDEMFYIALLIHILLGALFGLIYPVFVINEWLYITHSPYTFLSLIVYALHAWLVVMIIIFPILGFGFFGKREGRLVWVEMLISMLLIGVIMQAAVLWFQPFFFKIPI